MKLLNLAFITSTLFISSAIAQTYTANQILQMDVRDLNANGRIYECDYGYTRLGAGWAAKLTTSNVKEAVRISFILGPLDREGESIGQRIFKCTKIQIEE